MAEQNKTFKNEKQRVEDEDEGLVRFLASTESKDSHGDVVMQDGWKFRDHIPLLYGHAEGAEEPPAIGKIVDYEVTQRGLEVVAQFDLEDDFAQKIFRKVKDGFLKQGSVGFDPIEAEPLDDGRHRFLQQKLVEFSIVNVGSSPDTQPLEIKKYTTTEKEGRILSSENRQIVKEARDALDNLLNKTSSKHFTTTPTTKDTQQKPYDGPNDPQLMEDFPALEDMSEEEREQWLAVFEDVLNDAEDNEGEAAAAAFEVIEDSKEFAFKLEAGLLDVDVEKETLENILNIPAPWEMELDEWKSQFLKLNEEDESMSNEKTFDVDMLVEAYPELEEEDPEDLAELRDEINEAAEEIVAGFLEEDPDDSEEEKGVEVVIPDGWSDDELEWS